MTFPTISIAHRNQWIGITGAPETSLVSYDGTTNSKSIAYSFFLYRDQTGALSRYSGYANYAFKLQVSEDVKVSLGAAVGIISTDIDRSRLRILDVTDVNRSEDVPDIRGKTKFDFNIGINIDVYGLQIGFSVPQLFNTSVEYIIDGNTEQTAELNLTRHYTAHMYYRAKISEIENFGNIYIEPYAFVKHNIYDPVHYEGSLVLNVDKLMWLGGGYREPGNLAILSGINISQEISIGYTFEMPIVGKAVDSELGNSHQVTLAYKFSDAQPEMSEEEQMAIQEEEEEKLKEIDSIIMKRELELLAKLEAKIGLNTDSIAELRNRLENSKLQNIADSNNNSDNTKSKKSNGKEAKGKQKRSTVILEDRENEYAPNVDPNEHGYYLIVGVFNIKENAIRLNDMLKDKNFKVSYFYSRSLKRYYVFLRKYKDREKAEMMRSNGLNNTYPGELWVKEILE
ncbi:hypothetical protein JBKA6_0332 [Ichthyobacterium seriolicida]|uniref:SPOR domain-containing protein n=2 Tax=Ichthyobacterium seriolicida TaxID=242600 RepID=A0A1J1DWX0_9FLAO|nr:hypothetical protein JBKA6_0332 [Ichthyobacterium seriolicida]